MKRILISTYLIVSSLLVLAQSAVQARIDPIEMLIGEQAQVTLTIPKTTKVGDGVLLFHSYGTILNAREIGEGCRIVCNITLGDKKGKTPIIGKHVEILPGAVITGDVTIGDNSVIGPNAVVYKSVPANCVVVGNPAYILKRDGIVVNESL